MNPFVLILFFCGVFFGVAGPMLIKPIGQSITHHSIGCGRC